MIYKYGSDAAFQALITKAEALINAASKVASTAQATADQAIKDAAAAQSTADQALTRTLTQISGTLTVAKGGTGATSAAAARTNLGITPTNIGAAADVHTHAASDITSGSIPITRGGTGATDAATARTNLGITPANIGASASGHQHSASDITSGTLAVGRGGTGLAASPSMLVNLASANAGPVFTASPRPGVTGILPVANGGTGADDAETARTNLGITLKNLGAAAASHNHSAANITSGTLAVARGGTGVTSNPSMLVNLASGTAAGVFATSPRPGVTGILPVTNGGTGADDAATARTNLGITPANIGAAPDKHNHAASDITSGTIPISRGGTGATTKQSALSNLGALSKIAAYYPSSVEDFDLDSAIDGVMLIAQQFSKNCPLTSSSFIFIIQLFYSTTSTTSPRVQIALPYSGTGMAIRTFYQSIWSEWEVVGTSGNSKSLASSTLNGLMSAADKIKLDGIANDANAYVHPSTHDHSMINGLSANRALVSDSKGTISESSVTSTELGYLDGVTSAIQTQLNGKAAASHSHSASNITSGTLAIARGGTGATDAETARENLGITLSNLGAAAASHNHSASNITSGTLAIARGGTGMTSSPSMLVNLGSTTAANVLAASPRPGVTGTLPIARGGTGATSAAAALTALGAAKRAYYTCSVPTSSWTANSGGGYYKTITVTGILASDVPVVGVVLSSTVSTAKLQGAAFACINRITTAANSITCYAYNSAPTTAITLQLLVVR